MSVLLPVLPGTLLPLPPSSPSIPYSLPLADRLLSTVHGHFNSSTQQITPRVINRPPQTGEIVYVRITRTNTLRAEAELQLVEDLAAPGGVRKVEGRASIR